MSPIHIIQNALGISFALALAFVGLGLVGSLLFPADEANQQREEGRYVLMGPMGAVGDLMDYMTLTGAIAAAYDYKAEGPLRILYMQDIGEDGEYTPVEVWNDLEGFKIYNLLKPRVRQTCSVCGGSDVHMDANADWDVLNQRWVLGKLLGPGYCGTCTDEVLLKEVPINGD